VSLSEGWWGRILPEDLGERGRGGGAVVAGVTVASDAEYASHNPPRGCCGAYHG
jgi:hypothetical protein